MANLQDYYNIIESCISELGVDPVACRTQNPGSWDLTKGSASVWIDIWLHPDTQWAYLQVVAPVCQIPTNNTVEFMSELLELNKDLYGVFFYKYKDWVYIKDIRECEGMDKGEAMAIIRRVGTYADDYDDILKNKYFGGGGSAPV